MTRRSSGKQTEGRRHGGRVRSSLEHPGVAEIGHANENPWVSAIRRVAQHQARFRGRGSWRGLFRPRVAISQPGSRDDFGIMLVKAASKRLCVTARAPGVLQDGRCGAPRIRRSRGTYAPRPPNRINPDDHLQRAVERQHATGTSGPTPTPATDTVASRFGPVVQLAYVNQPSKHEGDGVPAFAPPAPRTRR